MPIIRNGKLEEDRWVHISDEDPILSDQSIIVSLERWRKDKDALSIHSESVGVRLRPDQYPSEIHEDLEKIDTIALEFPTFKDGRAFSHARTLRERHNYQGDLRAFGHILRDQFLFLDRCGVNVVEVDDTHDLDSWDVALGELTVSYQPATDSRRSVMSLRHSNETSNAQSEENKNNKKIFPDVNARIRTFSYEYGHLSTQRLLAAMIEKEFCGKIALVSSFGTEAAILLHMVAEIDRSVPVIFLDTGKLFGETLRYRNLLIDKLSLSHVRTITPDPDQVNSIDPEGMLWSKDADSCCRMRKVIPLEKALVGFDAWITGRKRYQGKRRAVLPVMESLEGRIKLNPLAGWTRDLIGEYFNDNELPRHPLESDGYQSIGCMPCTDRTSPGEGVRDGRWRGSEKTECGIHETLAEQSLTSSEL